MCEEGRAVFEVQEAHPALLLRIICHVALHSSPAPHTCATSTTRQTSRPTPTSPAASTPTHPTALQALPSSRECASTATRVKRQHQPAGESITPCTSSRSCSVCKTCAADCQWSQTQEREDAHGRRERWQPTSHNVRHTSGPTLCTSTCGASPSTTQLPLPLPPACDAPCPSHALASGMEQP